MASKGIRDRVAIIGMGCTQFGERWDKSIGDRVEMTFRRLFTADGVHNYFWKARPLREG